MKKIILVLGMLLCLLGVVACEKEEPEENYLEQKHYSIEGCEIDWAIDEGKGLRVYATAPDYAKGTTLLVFFKGCYQGLVDTDFTITVYVEDVYMTVNREGEEEEMYGVNIDGSEVNGCTDWFEEELEITSEEELKLFEELFNMDEFHKHFDYR